MVWDTARNIFVNLAVENLQRSMEFFSKLGFAFDPQFTDDRAACMVIGDAAFVMLLDRAFFKTFTRRELCDTTRHTEGLFALSCGSRSEVDEIVNKAVSLGGKPAMDPIDHGFMYSRSFYDLDDHHWEALWMDPRALEH